MTNKKSNELQVPVKSIDSIQKLRISNNKKRGKPPIRSKSNAKQNKDEQPKAQIEQLKEGAKVLKNNNKTETTKSRHIYINRNSQEKSKKPANGLRFTRRPTTKYGDYSSNKFYQRNNAKTKNLWQNIQSTARFKSDPIGSVVNLSNKKFTKDTFKLLNKNLNFIPTLKQTN